MFQADEPYSFIEIYKKYYVSLTNFARAKTGSIHDAEDLVHDLFADLYLKKESIGEIENMEGYLFIALKRRILNYWRHQDVAERFKLAGKETPRENDYGKALEIKDLINEIFSKAKDLSPQCQKVFYLKREELTNKEIASQLDISVKTVEAHYTKAINFLKKNVGYFILFLITIR